MERKKTKNERKNTAQVFLNVWERVREGERENEKERDFSASVALGFLFPKRKKNSENCSKNEMKVR